MDLVQTISWRPWLVVLLLAVPGAAATAEAAAPGGPPSGRALPAYATVVDETGLVDAPSIEALRRIADATTTETGIKLAVLVVPSLAGEDPDRLAARVYLHWKLGRRTQDDGLLLLYSLAEPWWVVRPGVALQARLEEDRLSPAVAAALADAREGSSLGRALVAAATEVARSAGASDAAVAEPYAMRRSWALVGKVAGVLALVALMMTVGALLERRAPGPSGPPPGWPGGAP